MPSKAPTKADHDKIRIVQRADGQIFTWTPQLDARPDMHAGYLYKNADGSLTVVLDRSSGTDLNRLSPTQREAALIDANAKLREQLAILQGAEPARPAIQLAPGESAIPNMEEFDNILEAAPVGETPISFQPEAPILPLNKLQGMRKELLIAHVQDLDRRQVIPVNATKQDLVDLCLDLQAKKSQE